MDTKTLKRAQIALDVRIADHARATDRRRQELREYAASALGGLWDPEDNMTVPLTGRLIEKDNQIHEMAERIEVLQITLEAKDMRLDLAKARGES